MTNKEIIIEELKHFCRTHQISDEDWGYEILADLFLLSDYEKLATNLLSKLNTLDWKKIDRIFATVTDNIEIQEGVWRKELVLWGDDIKNLKDQICQLIPEGEVIAEGKCKVRNVAICYRDGTTEWKQKISINGQEFKLSKLNDKNIIIKVVKK